MRMGKPQPKSGGSTGYTERAHTLPRRFKLGHSDQLRESIYAITDELGFRNDSIKPQEERSQSSSGDPRRFPTWDSGWAREANRNEIANYMRSGVGEFGF